jgi:hypothetical protein
MMGFEPTNAGATILCLSHLTTSTTMERMMGIEPTLPAWKAGILPLNYIRIVGAEDGIRTRDPRLGKAMLYH